MRSVEWRRRPRRRWGLAMLLYSVRRRGRTPVTTATRLAIARGICRHIGSALNQSKIANRKIVNPTFRVFRGSHNALPIINRKIANRKFCPLPSTHYPLSSTQLQAEQRHSNQYHCKSQSLALKVPLVEQCSPKHKRDDNREPAHKRTY